MEKRNGLKAKVRTNLPKELVSFLKKKRILCKFIYYYMNCYLCGYIEQERALMYDIRHKTPSEFLLNTFSQSSFSKLMI